MTKIEIQNTLAIGAIFALRMLGLFMILPVFSVYAIHLPGSNAFLIGIALGIYGLTQALFQLPMGVWSDYWPRRRVITIGLFIFALGSVVSALAHSIHLIIIGRALQGAGAIGSCLVALLTDLTLEKTRTHAMAIMGSMIGVAFVLAIILGPVLNHWLSVPGLFWLTSILALCALIILWRFVPAPSHTHTEFVLNQLPSQLKQALGNKALIPLHISITISHALLTALFVGLPTFLIEKIDLPLVIQWHLYLPALLISLLGVGAILRKRRETSAEKRLVFLCVAGILLAELLLLGALVVFPAFWLLLLTLIIFFTSFTLLEALLPSQVSKIAHASYRGAATGLFSTCQFLGIFLGGALGGYLIQHYRYFGDFVGCFLLALIWFLIMLTCQFKFYHSS